MLTRTGELKAENARLRFLLGEELAMAVEKEHRIMALEARVRDLEEQLAAPVSREIPEVYEIPPMEPPPEVVQGEEGDVVSAETGEDVLHRHYPG
jgi:hypothetical protein